MTGPFIQPNLYDVSGGGLHISYSTTGFDGKPHLTYHSAAQTKTFVGDQINSVGTPLGTLVTVVIFMTVDSGSTSFTLLVPRVNLNPNETVQIATEGITTMHKFSVVPIVMHGQLDFYTVQALNGTARHVVF